MGVCLKKNSVFVLQIMCVCVVISSRLFQSAAAVIDPARWQGEPSSEQQQRSEQWWRKLLPKEECFTQQISWERPLGLGCLRYVLYLLVSDGCELCCRLLLFNNSVLAWAFSCTVVYLFVFGIYIFNSVLLMCVLFPIL